eukprot:SAG11_NODE_789_length_7139_cov_5.205607_3_plen_166_part_00
MNDGVKTHTSSTITLTEVRNSLFATNLSSMAQSLNDMLISSYANLISIANNATLIPDVTTKAIDTGMLHAHAQGTHYFACSVGSLAWCNSGEEVVGLATGGFGCVAAGCPVDDACEWEHCELFGQKLTVIVAARDVPTTTSNTVHVAPLATGLFGAASLISMMLF